MLPKTKEWNMIRINGIKIGLEEKESVLLQKASKILGIPETKLLKLIINKKSIDARKKPLVFFNYTVDVCVENEAAVLKRCKKDNVSLVKDVPYIFPENKDKARIRKRIGIIGMGPAGLFCGYLLAKHGYNPIIFERGKRVEDRTADVERFWKDGVFDPDSNVQFGEGGAGTFSDGKLNTLVKDKFGRNKEVLRILVENGAPENILYDNKPHVGTDILSETVKNMRNKMLSWGAQIHYESKITDLCICNNRINGVVINHEKTMELDSVVLAIGHSARDTFAMLYDKKLPMEAKSFAVGFRVQHPQDFIDRNQYGMESDSLPAASYKLTAKTSVDRGVYSFCMCPGGYVVNASGEENMCAVNGMSYSKRDSGVANSAIIVQVTPKDYQDNSPLGGVFFQRELEKKAYALGKGDIPVQYYKDFSETEGRREYIPVPFEPKIKGKYVEANLRQIFPEEINRAFVEGMEHFNKIIPGFCDDFTILAGVESRTSSPVRINRDETLQTTVKGLYPCGEGAGYAGGITSAAMDGMVVAEAIAKTCIAGENTIK